MRRFPRRPARPAEARLCELMGLSKDEVTEIRVEPAEAPGVALVRWEAIRVLPMAVAEAMVGEARAAVVQAVEVARLDPDPFPGAGYAGVRRDADFPTPQCSDRCYGEPCVHRGSRGE